MKKLQKKSEFTVEKVIKRNDNKLYVKWKSYDNSYNSWIDKKYCYIKWVIFLNHIPVVKTK